MKFRNLSDKFNKIIDNSNIKKTKNVVGMLLNEIFYYKYAPILDESYNALMKLKNKYAGERCFIIATGPSLNITKISLLKDEIIFGMNTLYNALERFVSIPQYWGVVDSKVFVEHHKNILGLDTNLILAGGAGRYYLKNKTRLDPLSKNKPIILKAGKDMTVWGKMSTDISKGANGGGTVSIDVCLQMAYHMGFNEVYLLGCDCDYSGDKHFDGTKVANEKGLRAKGDWQDIFYSYEVCKKAFEEDGRKIYNATVGGKLDLFERRSLEYLFEGI